MGQEFVLLKLPTLKLFKKIKKMHATQDGVSVENEITNSVTIAHVFSREKLDSLSLKLIVFSSPFPKVCGGGKSFVSFTSFFGFLPVLSWSSHHSFGASILTGLLCVERGSVDGWMLWISGKALLF